MNISCRIANANTQCGRITNPPERECNFVDVLSSDTTDEGKIKAIDDIWKDYIEFSKGK